MKKWLLFFFLPISFCFSASFTDPHSGLNLDVPEAFSFFEQDRVGDLWWYEFRDANGNEFVIEVEECDYHKSLCEHFHRSLTGGIVEKEHMICEGVEFKNFVVGTLEISKCQLRILAFADMYCEPLCLCDYLFVRGQYCFTISLMKKEDDVDNEALMNSMLESIYFSN